ncbi:MAG TPA: LysR family transcriptional regulator [Solirubrobacteraceae bacterium]|nr:LysR family transcriptional regulator [Solirubrobacteraceae bacterium]
MELRQLEYFAAVARHGHFGRAALEVHVTQSALSQQIARLERELGLSLLARTPKGAALTPAGVEFNDHADAILRRVSQARAAIDGHRAAVRGIARIGATPHDSAAVPPALVAFHRAHPEVQLSLRHGSQGQLTELLAARMIDVAVLGVHDRGAPLGSGALVRVISEEPLRLVCAPEDPIAGAAEVTIETLRGVPVILPERGTALRELVVRSCQEAGFSPLPLFETSDPLTIRSLAAEGLGCSAVPASWLTGNGPAVGVAGFGRPVPRYRVALVHSTDLPPLGMLLVNHLDAFFTAARDGQDSDVSARGSADRPG